MALNSRKIVYPTASDLFSPHTDMKKLADSAITVTPVANITERASVAALLTPSASNPVYTHRADAPSGCELEVTVNGTTWRTLRATSGWAAFTPAIAGTGGSPTLGAGTITGRYLSDGLTQRGSITIDFGAGATAGAGQYYITLPLTTPLTPPRVIGTALLYDSSATVRAIAAVQVISTTQVVLSAHGATINEVGAGNPWTWAAGDFIRLSFDCEVG